MDVIWMLVALASIYLAGRLAERRGRRFVVWAWVGAFIGPLALPLVLLFPKRRENGDA